jgi:hypothetical protein
MMELLWRMVQKVNGYGDGVGSRNKEGKDKGGKGLGYKGMFCTHFPLHLFTLFYMVVHGM